MPTPQAIGVSSETWHGVPRRAASPARACSIGSGPQPTRCSGGGVLLQQLRDEAVKADAAVVAGQMDFGPGRAEVLDAGRQVGRAHAVEERHALAPLRCGGRPP